MTKLFLIFFSICLLSGCSYQKQDYERFDLMVGAKRHAEFDVNQYKPYMKKGKGRIRGEFCIILDNGKKECPPDQLVLLNPVTDYSNEWYQRHWVNNEFLSAPDPRTQKYTKLTKTDKGGWFTFVDLPPGEYYVGAVLCPCDGFSEKERSNFKYQRYGTKVRMKKSIKANLEKVFE